MPTRAVDPDGRDIIDFGKCGKGRPSGGADPLDISPQPDTPAHAPPSDASSGGFPDDVPAGGDGVLQPDSPLPMPPSDGFPYGDPLSPDTPWPDMTRDELLCELPFDLCQPFDPSEFDDFGQEPGLSVRPAVDVEHDFNPQGPDWRTGIPANPDWLYMCESGGASAVAHLGFYGRYMLRDCDAFLLSDDFLWDVRGQQGVTAQQKKVARKLENRAVEMLEEQLLCDQTGWFADKGKGKVLARFNLGHGANVRLSLQRFALYWEAECTLKPKQCCVVLGGCDDGAGSSASYRCSIWWTVRDKYNFQCWNPFGWLGKPFEIVGHWTTPVAGEAKSCED
jgi:hypothetical protein